MIRSTLRIAAAVLLAFPGCASAAYEDEDRRAYVLARPHAWVEVTIGDVAIPDIPRLREDKVELVAPSQCRFSVSMNGEPWLSDYLYPQGAVAPYFIRSGYRFPVPAGIAVNLRIRYEGCRVREETVASVALTADLFATEDLVYELIFDGDRVSPEPPRPDPVVSLDDVYQALTGRRSPQE